MKRLTPAYRDSHIEQKVANVAVLHDVGLTFDAELSGGTDVFFCLVGFQIRQRVDFATDEASFEVAVDDSCGLRCRGSNGNGPGADFFLAGGEVALKSQSLVRRSCARAERGFGQADGFQHFRAIGGVEFREFRFQLGADGNDGSAVL